MSFLRTTPEGAPQHITRAHRTESPDVALNKMPMAPKRFGWMPTLEKENLTRTRMPQPLRWLPFVAVLIYLSLCLWVLVEAYIVIGPSTKQLIPLSGICFQQGSKQPVYVTDCALIQVVRPTLRRS